MCALVPQAHLTIGPVDGSGMRGTTATDDIRAGETIALLPAKLVTDLESALLSAPVSMHHP